MRLRSLAIDLRSPRSRRPLLIAGCFLLIVTPTLFILARQANKTAAAWFDDSWTYRNALPISSHTSLETNVYITATIDTSASGQFQGDCGDLRFTTYGGELLPYYIASGCTTATTVVHVFFTSFPAGAQTLYYYYGNPSADNGFSASDFATEATNYALGSIASQEVTQGPVAYWKFDEGYGATVNNSTSVSGINGTKSSNTTWKTESDCLNGKCLDFPGTGDPSVSVSNNTNLNFGTNSFTVEMWGLYRDYTYPKAWFMIKKSGTCYSAGNPGWDIGHGYNANGISICYSDGTNGVSNASVTFDSGYKPTDTKNKWTHLTVVFDKSANKVKFYVNGVKQSNEYNISAVTGSISNSAALSMGTMYGWQSDGRMDDVKIYPYARTAAQIKSDYASRGSIKGTSVALGGSSTNSDALSNGLVGYWKMDEASWNGSANEVIDSSGNANHGVGVGATAPPTTGAGKFGNGGVFDGTEDYVNTNISPTLSAGDSHTISFWAKRNQTQINNYPMMINNSSGSIQIGFVKSGGLLYYASGKYFSSTYFTDYSSWHLFTYTYSNSLINLYIDGDIKESVSYTSPAISDLKIGGTYHYAGNLDEVRIYNRALSPAEVRDLYNYAPGPVAYYNFDEGTGTSAYDKIGGRTGTLLNGASWGIGKYGKALKLNVEANNNQYVSVSSGVTHNNSFTKEAWINPTSFSGCPETRCSILSPYFEALTGSSGLQYYDNSLSPTGWHTGGTLSLNIWQHVAVSYDGTNLKLYVNGIQVKSVATTNTGTHSSGVIGAYGNNSRNFKGYIDEVRIFDYARTPGQIVEDMNAGHPLGGSPIGSQVAYYKFNEGYGTTANNSGFGGTALNGSLGVGTSAPTWSNAGKFGKALSFDGNDYVDLTNGVSVKNLSTISVSAWVYPTSISANKAIWAELINGSSAQRLGLTIRSDGSVDLGGRDTDGGSFTKFAQTATSKIAINNWYHLTGVYDANTDSHKVYINGIDSTSSTIASATFPNTNPFKVPKIGSSDGTADFFSGLIDEVKIYNTALTADEILIDMNQGAAMVMGSTSTDASGNASNSASRAYCIPGDTTSCSPPVAEWKLDEGSGTSAQDTSGNANTGTLGSGSAAPTWSIGKFGKALKFDGSNDYVDMGTPSSLNLINNFSTFLWFKGTSKTNNQGLISWGQSEQSGAVTGGSRGLMILQTSGYFIFRGYNANVLSTTNVADGNWHHLGVTCSSSNLCTLYLDGAYLTSGTPSLVNFTLSYFRIGKTDYTSPEQATGQIDQVRVYDYVRTPAQIAWDYNRGAPVGHWKLDECQGTVANDASGNGNNGTITAGDDTGSNDSVGTCTGSAGEMWADGATGKRNASLEFDGTNDYIDVGLPLGANSSETKTISAWIYPTAASSGYVVANYDASSNGFSLLFNSDRTIGIAWTSTGNAVRTTDTVSLNAWSHLVAVLDTGTTGGNIYINGKLSKSGNLGTEQTTTNKVKISSRWITANSGAAAVFSGQIDDVKIYNYALTATQVKTLMNEGSAIRFGP